MDGKPRIDGWTLPSGPMNLTLRQAQLGWAARVLTAAARVRGGTSVSGLRVRIQSPFAREKARLFPSAYP